jgi:hypothetical protein
VGSLDPERVHQADNSLRTVREVLRMFGWLVRKPEPGLIDGDCPKRLGEDWQIAAKVAPRRRTGPTAVQEHTVLPCSVPAS